MNSEAKRGFSPTAGNLLTIPRTSRAWEGAGVLLALALASLLGAVGIVASMRGI